MAKDKKDELEDFVDLESTVKLLMKRCDENGIASCKVSDGHVYIVSKDYLKSLADKLEREGRDRAILFIQEQDEEGPPGEKKH